MNMAMSAPGMLYFNTTSPIERMVMHQIISGANKAGYERLIIPAAGSFVMAHVAVQAGFPAEKIVVSDVTLFSTVWAYGIMGKKLDKLEIEMPGLDDATDPATVLWSQVMLRASYKKGVAYWDGLIRHWEDNREKQIESINKAIKRARSKLGKMSYEMLDLKDHLISVANDEETIVYMNPPCYKAGYEKFFKEEDQIKWNSPSYEIFDPVEGYNWLLRDYYVNAKPLVVATMENQIGVDIAKLNNGVAIQAQGNSRKRDPSERLAKSLTFYLTSNRRDEVKKYTDGKLIVSDMKSMKLSGTNAKVMGDDYVPTADTEIKVIPIKGEHAMYYRMMWQHGFMSTASHGNLALMLDGQLAGIFGFDGAYLSGMGQFGSDSDMVLLLYGMQAPVINKVWRVNRLITRVALTRDIIGMALGNGFMLNKVARVNTAQITKYPESKEYRGLMKMVKRQKTGDGKFNLVYRADVTEDELNEAYRKWYADEVRYQKVRAKEKQ